ncbi:hypothetical protein M5K25_026863 [Dendrobium thyrsiflorum]|uniref:Uncharacterized protein n=1 Tax=Dendrobium thyrsiflorum TaxID=117978 RepID=A0ABD0TYM6_DENTH
MERKREREGRRRRMEEEEWRKKKKKEEGGGEIYLGSLDGEGREWRPALERGSRRESTSVVHPNHSQLTLDLSHIYKPCHFRKSINRAPLSHGRRTQAKGREVRERSEIALASSLLLDHRPKFRRTTDRRRTSARPPTNAGLPPDARLLSDHRLTPDLRLATY